jgi:triosephosphate isomerase
MTEKYLIANWKMQLSQEEAGKQALALKKLLAEEKINSDLKIVLCPDFVSLAEVAGIVNGSKIALGAQDGFYEEKGAFTSQVSMKQIKDIGCQYVILGHSERRALGETDEIINKKVKAALEQGLIPIICVGETFEERKEGQKDLVIMHQIYEALKNIKPESGQKIIIAYEPVWVIGTGQAISGADAFYAASLIQQSLLDSQTGLDEKNFGVIYGGSVSPENINDFLELPNIHGALVGNASLEAQKFLAIIKKINPVK